METKSCFFHETVEKFGKSDIELFATRIEKQLDMSLDIQNQRQWLSMPCLLPGTTIISTCS